MRSVAALLVVLTLASASAAAPVAPPEDVEIVAARTETSFYGWQILIGGEVGALASAGAIVLPDEPLQSAPATAAFIIGAPTYALSGPIAHWTHGHFAKGLISFGGNIALPLAAGAVGAATGYDRGFAKGVALGLLLAPVADALILGWEEVPIDYIGKGSGPLVAPYVSFNRGAALLGVWYRF
jgi:hypothetical protein